MASPITEHDAKLLGFALGESSSLGVAETLAMVALEHWGRLLAAVNVEVTIQSDSVTALALTQKFSNSGPALNFLGAELAVTREAFWPIYDQSTCLAPPTTKRFVLSFESSTTFPPEFDRIRVFLRLKPTWHSASLAYTTYSNAGANYVRGYYQGRKKWRRSGDRRTCRNGML